MNTYHTNSSYLIGDNTYIYIYIYIYIFIAQNYQHFDLFQARRRCTTAACVERCCRPSAPSTVTCLYTRASGHSHVRCVAKRSPPTATCTDTGAPTTYATLSRATARLAAVAPPLAPVVSSVLESAKQRPPTVNRQRQRQL